MKNIDLSIFGLNTTEQEIYKSALRLGPASVHAVAKAANVKRTTAYFAVENLKEKGLMIEKIKGAVKIIEPVEPEYLREILHKEKTELDQKISSAADLITGLKTLAKATSNYSEVKYYEGKRHIKKVFDDILITKSDVLWFGTMSAALQSTDFQEIYQSFSKARRKMGGTKSYVISDRHKYAKELWFQDNLDFREFRFLPEDVETEGAVVVYGDKAALFSFGELFRATVIQNGAIAGVMKVMFRLIWDKAEKEV